MKRCSRSPAAKSASLSVLTHRQAVVLLLGVLAVVQGDIVGDLRAQSPPAAEPPRYLSVYQVPTSGPADTDLHFRTRCIGVVPEGAERGSLELPASPGSSSKPVTLGVPCDHPFTWPISEANHSDPAIPIRLRDGQGQLSDIPIPYFLSARDEALPENAAPPAFVQALAAGSSWMALGTRDGLYLLDTVSGAANRVDLERTVSTATDPGGPVVTAVDARQERLWAATSRGVCVVDRGDGSIRCEPPPAPDVIGGAAGRTASQVLIDPINDRCAVGIGPHHELRRYMDAPGSSGLSSAKVPSAQLPSAQVSSAQVSSAQVSSAQVSSAQVSSAEVNSAWRDAFEHLLWLRRGDVWQLWATGKAGTRILSRVSRPGDPCGTLEESPSNAISRIPASRLAQSQSRVWAVRGGTLRCWVVSQAGVALCPGFDQPRELGVGTISALSADPLGVWLGTTQGLFRLPASGLGNARRIALEAAPGASSRVLTLSPGPQGALWVGTASGLFRCSPDERCTRLPGRAEGLDGAWITAVHRGADHRFWIGDTQGAIHALNQSPHSWKAQLNTVFRLQGSTVDVQDGRRRILALLEHDGRLWMGLEHGLRRGRLLPEGGMVLERMKFELPAGVLADSHDFDPEVRALTADELGRIWVGTSEGLFFWRSTGGTEPKARASASPGRALTDKGIDRAVDASTVHWRRLSGEIHDIRDLLVDHRRGWLWVASHEGLFVFEGSELEAKAPLPGLPAPLQGPINRLYEASDGHIWIGLEDGGLYRWPARSSSLFSNASTDDPDRFELLELPPLVSSTASSPSISTPTSLFGGAPFAPTTPPLEKPGAILAIGEDRLNGLWVLTGAGGSSERRAWCLTTGGIWQGPFGAASGLSQVGGALLARDWHGALWTGGSLTWLTPERSCTKARADLVAGGHGVMLVALLLGWMGYWGYGRKVVLPAPSEGSSSSPGPSPLRRFSPILVAMGAFIGMSGTMVTMIRLATLDMFKAWDAAGGGQWLLLVSGVLVAVYNLKVHLDEAQGSKRWTGFVLAVATLGVWTSVLLAAHREHPLSLCQCVPDSSISTNVLIGLGAVVFLLAFPVVARSFIPFTAPQPPASQLASQAAAQEPVQASSQSGRPSSSGSSRGRPRRRPHP